MPFGTLVQILTTKQARVREDMQRQAAALHTATERSEISATSVYAGMRELERLRTQADTLLEIERLVRSLAEE